MCRSSKILIGTTPLSKTICWGSVLDLRIQFDRLLMRDLYWSIVLFQHFALYKLCIWLPLPGSGNLNIQNNQIRVFWGVQYEFVQLLLPVSICVCWYNCSSWRSYEVFCEWSFISLWCVGVCLVSLCVCVCVCVRESERELVCNVCVYMQ